MGWDIKTLGDICDFSRGLTYKKSDEVSFSKNGVLRANNISLESGSLILDEIKYISEDIEIPETKKVRKGSILICTASGSKKHLGKAALIDKPIDLAFGGFMGMLTPKENVFPKYLYWITQSHKYSEFILNLTDGANINNLKFSQLSDFRVSLPPLEEQKKIVAILDKVFAEIDKARTNAEQNLNNARELLDSYLNQVFSQRGEGWEEKKLGEVAQIINGHSFKSKDFDARGEVKAIKITNVGVHNFVVDNISYLPNSFADIYSAYKAETGDIVIALTRTIISSGLKVAIVPIEFNNSLINQRVAAIRLEDNSLTTHLLNTFLSTKIAINYVKSNVNELMQPNLSIKDLKEFPIPVPPKEKLNEITESVVKLKGLIFDLDKIYKEKLNILAELKKSILQKAFSGELT